MEVNSKRFGSIGEAKALCWCVEHKIPVSIPFCDNEPYDLVIELGGKLLKVQVKSSSIIEDGKLIFYIRSSRSNKLGQHVYTEDEVDLFILYHTTTDRLYAVYQEECKDTYLSLRLEECTLLEKKTSKKESDFRIERILGDVSPLPDKE